MTDNLYQHEAEFALSVLRDGSRLARQIRADHGKVHVHKHDRSPVTLADLGVQALVAGRLEKAFPDDPLVAEEEPASLQEDLYAARLKDYLYEHWPEVTDRQILDWIGRGSDIADQTGRFWTLDPVDGTKGYIRGGQYALALALVEAGRVVLGVLGCPEYGPGGSVAFALHGGGAWHEPLEGGERVPLAASRVNHPSEARLVRSVEPSHTNLNIDEQLQTELGIKADPLLVDSQVKYLMLAKGEAEMMFRLPPAVDPDYKSMIWDQAAGSLLLEEAGGRVSDLDGRGLDFSTGKQLLNNRGVFASNGLLHDAGLQALSQHQV